VILPPSRTSSATTSIAALAFECSTTGQGYAGGIAESRIWFPPVF
jgi:hypothetical protein